MSEKNDFLSSGNRDNTEIMAAIVVLAQNDPTITSIMSKVKLSYSQTRRYIDLTISRGLIRKSSDEKVVAYEQTEKGCKFLRVYCEMLRLLYGEDFVKNKSNLTVACLSQCQERE